MRKVFAIGASSFYSLVQHGISAERPENRPTRYGHSDATIILMAPGVKLTTRPAARSPPSGPHPHRPPPAGDSIQPRPCLPSGQEPGDLPLAPRRPAGWAPGQRRGPGWARVARSQRARPPASAPGPPAAPTAPPRPGSPPASAPAAAGGGAPRPSRRPPTPVLDRHEVSTRL